MLARIVCSSSIKEHLQFSRVYRFDIIQLVVKLRVESAFMSAFGYLDLKLRFSLESG